MADRFPSLDDFDSGAQTDVKDTSVDPSTDDFLAREKAALGDDADQFATAQDVSVLDGSGGDLLGENEPTQSTFESQFPDLAGHTVGSGLLPGAPTMTGPSVTYNSGFQATVQDEDEPAVIKEWRERRNAQIEKRSQQFAAQREETIQEAQANIDDFYNNYNSKKEKEIAKTRKEAEEFLANRDDTVSGGTSWDRIAKLVDVSGKGSKGGANGSGKERFRELLMSLRKDEKAPGATGY
ncbi:Clathrin light chain [Geosmithia morbida]|uniref:Clathrin light chain n=1 Tax=Geosmithia morbida TaxID=1094350 RepID=A0A9P4YRI8_9HYPO|nr:Clathrin light chain [Geosmithia morbida]KAF4121793.1 Clathrin light chain [Geosmithia morbida]